MQLHWARLEGTGIAWRGWESPGPLAGSSVGTHTRQDVLSEL